MICDNIYEEGSNCKNIILRHLRFRNPESDTLRLGGTEGVMVDHCSFENTIDESIEISRSNQITVQYSVIAEPVGEHFRWGGVLMNYSTRMHPLDNITLHHNVWNGVFGRLPEISCEENNDAPGSNCGGHVIHLELTSNLLFDASDPVWYNRCVGNNEGNECRPAASNFQVALNWSNNVMMRRSGVDDAPMIEQNIYRAPNSTVYSLGNLLFTGAVAGAVASSGVPHDFPKVTMTPAATLVDILRDQAGALPHDPMDRRLSKYLQAGVDARPPAWEGESGIDRGDALTTDPSSVAPVDTDGDGMPDRWEVLHHLDPSKAGASENTLSSEGYTNLEVYLNGG